MACSVLFCFVSCFFKTVSLCGPGCLGTPSINQAGLELRDPHASASLSARSVLGSSTFFQNDSTLCQVDIETNQYTGLNIKFRVR